MNHKQQKSQHASRLPGPKLAFEGEQQRGRKFRDGEGGGIGGGGKRHRPSLVGVQRSESWPEKTSLSLEIVIVTATFNLLLRYLLNNN